MDLEYERRDDGSLALIDGGDTVLSIPAEGEFGLLYDCDSGNGGAMATSAFRAAKAPGLKHGPAERVRAEHQRRWTLLNRGGATAEGLAFAAAVGHLLGPAPAGHSRKNALREAANDLRLLVIPVAEITDPILEEINACLAIP